jgi:hypothetical protein
MFSTPNSFCMKFTKQTLSRDRYESEFEADRRHSDFIDDPQPFVEREFGGLTSINAILDKVKNQVSKWNADRKSYEEFRKQEKEDAKKWFWQRK